MSRFLIDCWGFLAPVTLLPPYPSNARSPSPLSTSTSVSSSPPPPFLPVPLHSFSLLLTASSTPNTMGDVDLFCLIQGESLEHSFHVTISREKHVSYLRECIIAKCGGKLEGVTPGDLRLYCISVVDDSELARLDVQDNPPLLPRTIIGTLFPNGPGENEYIFIVNGMMLRCGLICVSFPNYTYLRSH